MFKLRIVVVCLLVLLASPSWAAPDPYADTYFNIGGEISIMNRTSYNSGNTSDLNAFKTSNNAGKLAISRNEPGFNIFLGARFNQYLGGEIGFGFIQKAQANVQNNNQASNKISNTYADFLAFINIANKVDMFGLVGVGGLKSKPNVTNYTLQNPGILTKVKVGLRLGGGLQYNFDESWASRAVLRWQDGNKDFLKALISISVGVLYTF